MIRKTITYLFVITLALYGLRYLHHRGLLKTQGYYLKYQRAFFGTEKYTVLFLGSSRAEMAYDTGLYDTLSGQTSFNLGTAGATPRLAHALLCTYLESHPVPQIVYYEIDFHALKKAGTEIKNFNNFFPFLKHKSLRERFAAIDPRMAHFYYNPYYSWPYTGFKNISTGLHGWLGIPTQNEDDYYNGFLREQHRPVLTPSPLPEFYVYFHAAERAYLDSIILTTRSLGAEPRLVCSPAFKGAKQQVGNKAAVIQQIRNIAKTYKIRFFELSDPEFSQDPSCFVDPYHLNFRGARQFTRLLITAEGNKTPPVTLK